MTTRALWGMWQYYLFNWWPRTYLNKSWQVQERLGELFLGSEGGT